MASQTNWKQHIEAWQASGLSRTAYCRQHGLRPATFTARLREHRSLQPLSASAALVPVRIGPAKASEPLVLKTASGHCLELPLAAGPGWVAELLRCLG
jgi:hypothetical protein